MGLTASMPSCRSARPVIDAGATSRVRRWMRKRLPSRLARAFDESRSIARRCQLGEPGDNRGRNGGDCLRIFGTGTGIRTPVPWLRNAAGDLDGFRLRRFSWVFRTHLRVVAVVVGRFRGQSFKNLSSGHMDTCGHPETTPRLASAQRHERVDACGATSGDPGGDETGDHEHRPCGGVDTQVIRPHIEEKRFRETGEAERAAESEGESARKYPEACLSTDRSTVGASAPSAMRTAIPAYGAPREKPSRRTPRWSRWPRRGARTSIAAAY